MLSIVNDPNYIFSLNCNLYRTITKPIIFLNNSFQFQSVLHVITKKKYIMKTATKLTKFILQFFFCSAPHTINGGGSLQNFVLYFFSILNSIFHTPKRYHYSLYFIHYLTSHMKNTIIYEILKGGYFYIDTIIDITEQNTKNAYFCYAVLLQFENIFNIINNLESVACGRKCFAIDGLFK